MARAHGAQVFLATMSPAWGRDAFERPGQARYHALYRDLARTRDVGLIDTTPQWYALGVEPQQVVPLQPQPADGCF